MYLRTYMCLYIYILLIIIIIIMPNNLSMLICVFCICTVVM